MSVKLCFFARFREKLGVNEEQLALTGETTVDQVLRQLAGRGGAWAALFACPEGVLAAVNQDMGSLQTVVRDGDELALFPPVTGG